ncbi:MAG TPA: hypothetical protein VEZ71_13635, partial [Archangium sp.]|nr:hypothetical protein [Archangium sp.]
RAAARGELHAITDPRLAALTGPEPGQNAVPSELASLVAAAALVNASWTLDQVITMAAYTSPGVQALEIVARAAVRAGHGRRVLDQARRHGFVSDQAEWLQAATVARVATDEEVVSLVSELAPRVADELDFGRELIAGLPLLVALAHRGHYEALVSWAAFWRTPPPVFVEYLLLFARHAAASLAKSPLLNHLLEIQEAEWNTTYEFDLPFWDSSDAAGSFQDALTVTAYIHWDVVPGTLMDVVFGRAGTAVL